MLEHRAAGELSKLDSCLSMEQFNKHLTEMQCDFSDSLGAPKVKIRACLLTVNKVY